MLGDINNPDVRASMSTMPHFYKKWKLLKRVCHECWAEEHDVYLVVTPLKDFYICEQCKKAYDEQQKACENGHCTL